MLRFIRFASTFAPSRALCVALAGCGAPATAPVAPSDNAPPAVPQAALAAPVAAAPPATVASSTPSPPPAATAAAPTAAQAPASRCPDGMALVAGGSFQRGGTGVKKKVADLCVDLLETTPPEYQACVTAGKCNAQGVDCAAQSTYGKPEKSKHPMVCLIFSQAQDYCVFRGKRLPTTEEWEWAARGGDEARRYPWGDTAPDAQLCWAGKQKQSESCDVGSFPGDKSAQGVLDLAGNVLEFTTTDGDKTSKIRIARGGSWNSGAPELFRNTRLGGFGLDYRCAFLGVRCVQEAPAEAP